LGFTRYSTFLFLLKKETCPIKDKNLVFVLFWWTCGCEDTAHVWYYLLTLLISWNNFILDFIFYTPAPRRGRVVCCFTSVRLSVLPSVQDIFLSNYRWQKSDIWSQASYRYAILWVAFLDPSDSYFRFADLVGFYTHWTYMHIFRHIFLRNYWWQESDIWSQASYRYPISWEAFLDPSDSYFLFADLVGFYTHWTYMRGYHKWALAHSSSCCIGQHFVYLKCLLDIINKKSFCHNLEKK
jgi:hypothetical protein